MRLQKYRKNVYWNSTKNLVLDKKLVRKNTTKKSTFWINPFSEFHTDSTIRKQENINNLNRNIVQEH